MILKIDLHVHSVYSPDSSNGFGEINRCCRLLGIDGYAVCDHDTVSGLGRALEEAEEMVVVPGLEVTARGAHVLCLQPAGGVPPTRSIRETVDLIHRQGGTAVIAHPYGVPRSWVNIREAEHAGLDAVEVANSAQWPYGVICRWNRGLAGRLGLPMTGGSDSHTPATVGRCYTVVDSETRDAEGVVRAIRLGRTSPVGAGITLRERLAKSMMVPDRTP
jgi:hypothetical protein